MTVFFRYNEAMNVLSVSSIGGFYLLLLLTVCFVIVHVGLLAMKGAKSLGENPPKEAPPPEPVYYIVEKKKKRKVAQKYDYETPKEITFPK